MPVRALVDAADLFGIEANATRVALTRLRAAGLVSRDERGRYRLGPAAEAVAHRVASWRNLQSLLRAWEGGWVGVVTTGLPRDRGRVAGRERALRLTGFRPLRPSLQIRPDNLAGGVGGLRERLTALGLEPEAPVLGIGDLDLETEAAARALWDLGAMRVGYTASIQRLARSEGRVASLRAEQAMVETFLAGGEVIRQLVFDPLLPEPLIPGAERRALIEALRRYDRLGRACWAGFLARYEVPHRQAPVDLRVDADAAGWSIQEGDIR